MTLKKFFISGLVVAFSFPVISWAAGMITLSPAKHEITLQSGEEVTRTIKVVNNLGREAVFTVEVEDFAGTQDLNNPVNLLGDKLGPYSLKNYVFPATRSFRLRAGEQYTLPVMIRLSPAAPPGGLYGAVLVSANNDTEPAGVARVSTRLGSLFFVKVDGPVNEAGELRKFNSVRGSFFAGRRPILAQIVYENTGNVYLNPYAQVEVKNWFGRSVKMIRIDPWYVLPGSLRSQTVEWKYPWFSFGRYSVNLYLNKGYQNQIAIDKFTVWVFPWPLVLLLVLIVLVFGRFKKRHV